MAERLTRYEGYEGAGGRDIAIVSESKLASLEAENERMSKVQDAIYQIMKDWAILGDEMICRIQNKVKTFEAKNKNLRETLERVGVCPNCGDQGWYVQATMGEDGLPEPEQVQCQWCYENEHSLFNRDRRIRSEIAGAIMESCKAGSVLAFGSRVVRMETLREICDRHITPRQEEAK